MSARRRFLLGDVVRFNPPAGASFHAFFAGKIGFVSRRIGESYAIVTFVPYERSLTVHTAHLEVVK